MTPEESEAFLALIDTYPLRENIDSPPRCPSCLSEQSKETGFTQTLVGGAANHFWQYAECARCGLEYCREWKEHGEGVRPNVWYTRDRGRVVRGVPSCFEDYRYACAKCGETVRRAYVDKATGIEGGTTSGYTHNVDGKWITTHRIVYRCDGCWASATIENDSHWKPT